MSKADRKWVAKGFLLLFKIDPSSEFRLRVGYTTSRKLGNAVVRNRIRRRLKEAMAITCRTHDREAPAFSFDIVIIGRKTSYDCDFDYLKVDMRKALDFVLTQGQK